MAALYRGGTGSAGEDLGPQYTLDLLSRFNLPAEQLFEVFDHCRDVDIDIMCTPWDAPSVDALVDYGIPALKIASADLTNHALLTHAAASGTPLVVSTGMSTETEIRESVAVLRASGTPYALLHCQSTYPAPFKDVNLRYLTRLAELGDCPVGYSGHERGFHVPVAAVALGASIIEKHFTVDRGMEGNDHKVSPAARRVRRDGRAHPRGRGGPRQRSRRAPCRPGEMMNRVNLAKSLVAARDLERRRRHRPRRRRHQEPRPRPAAQRARPARRPHRQPRRCAPATSSTPPTCRTPCRRAATSSSAARGACRCATTTSRPSPRDCTPDFLEFHFSYKDLEIDPADGARPSRLPMGYAVPRARPVRRRLHPQPRQRGRRALGALDRRAAAGHRPHPLAAAVLHHRRRPGRHRPASAASPPTATCRSTSCPTCTPGSPPASTGSTTAGVRLSLPDPAALPLVHGRPALLQPVRARLRHRRVRVALRPPALPRRLAHQARGRPSSASRSPRRSSCSPRTADHLHLVDAVGRRRRGRAGRRRRDRLGRCSPASSTRSRPGSGFIPEIWQGHVNNGEGFWLALERLEQWF